MATTQHKLYSRARTTTFITLHLELWPCSCICTLVLSTYECIIICKHIDYSRCHLQMCVRPQQQDGHTKCFLAGLNDIVAWVWVLAQTKRVWIAVIMICHDSKAGGSFLSKTPDTHTKKRPHTPADITVHQHIPFVNDFIYFTQHPTLTWIQVLLVSGLRQANIFVAACATIKVSESDSGSAK